MNQERGDSDLIIDDESNQVKKSNLMSLNMSTRARLGLYCVIIATFCENNCSFTDNILIGLTEMGNQQSGAGGGAGKVNLKKKLLSYAC